MQVPRTSINSIFSISPVTCNGTKACGELGINAIYDVHLKTWAKTIKEKFYLGTLEVSRKTY